MTYEVYLAHHGIKGMKWGVRRFQDENGRLTPEGKIHYGVDSKGNLTEKGRKRVGRALRRQKMWENQRQMEEDIGTGGRYLAFMIGRVPANIVYQNMRISQIKNEVARGQREMPEWMKEINVEELLRKAGVK